MRYVSVKDEGTMPASPGTIWMCVDCGKKSETRYGFDHRGEKVSAPGWDASCAAHAVLVRLPPERTT